jgi:hypothetical protein
MNHQKDLLKTLIDLLDGIVEVFLSAAVQPLLSWHASLDDGLDQILVQLVRDHQDKIPRQLGYQAVAYARLCVALPTVVFLAGDDLSLTSALLVMCVFLAASLERAIADWRYSTVDGSGSSSSDAGEESPHGLSSAGSAEEDSFGT